MRKQGDAKGRLSPFASLPEAAQSSAEFIVTHLRHLFEMRYRQGKLKSFKISFREWLTLDLLATTPRGLPQFIIGSHLSLPPTVVVVLIDKLSARELVERNENPANRREKIVTLTASGRETVTNIKQINASILTDECDRFVQTATRMICNVEANFVQGSLKGDATGSISRSP